MRPRTRSGAPFARAGTPATVLAALLAAGCSEARPVLEVYAASSLTEAFSEMDRAFRAAHPDIETRLTFAGSQVLRVQIEQGARADLFASANPSHVEALLSSGLVGPGSVFARNELVVITPTDDPSGIEEFGDLPRASRLVVGTANVPIGAYAREAIHRAAGLFGPGFEEDVHRRIVSEEPNVRLVRAKVELGEADAAIVYRTDVAGSDRLRVVPIPPEINVRAAYVLSRVARTVPVTPEAGDAWIAFVLSDEGQAILARYGFLPPTDVDS